VTPNNYLATELDRSHVATLSELSEGTGFAANRLEEQARELDSIRFVDEQTVANEQWWEDQLSALTENVDTYHRDHPQRPGLPLEDIPAELDPVREPVLAALADRGYVAEDAYLRRSDFEAHLTDEGKQKREALLETLRDQGLETDDRDDLEEQYGAEVVSFCHWKGDVVVLSDQRLVAASVYDDLVDRIIEYMSSEQPCRLSELRDCLDSSRQYVIPLMEHLDQEGMTVRDDDVRYLGDGVAQSG
jgi:selenocysteine-specific elongation factor